MEQRWTCPECCKTITTEDSVVFVRDRLAHRDCRGPRNLSPEERVLLFLYCWRHAVAKCGPCASEYRESELASDRVGAQQYLCPGCRADLLDSVRVHLYACSTLPAEVRRQAQMAREAARALVKRGRELTDRADVLMREAEVTLSALRETMRNVGKRSP